MKVLFYVPRRLLQTQQNSQWWYLLGRTSRRFLWCWLLLLLLLFYLTGGFSFIAFRRHPSPFRELSLGFYTHFIFSAQFVAKWFATLSFELFSAFTSQFYRERYSCEQAFFTLHSFPRFWHVFVTQMQAGTPHPGSSSVPALTGLSLLTHAWSWTTHIVDKRPLVYPLHK